MYYLDIYLCLFFYLFKYVFLYYMTHKIIKTVFRILSQNRSFEAIFSKILKNNNKIFSLRIISNAIIYKMTTPMTAINLNDSLICMFRISILCFYGNQ